MKSQNEMKNYFASFGSFESKELLKILIKKF